MMYNAYMEYIIILNFCFMILTSICFALCVLSLVDRGEIDNDLKAITAFWNIAFLVGVCIMFSL